MRNVLRELACTVPAIVYQQVGLTIAMAFELTRLDRHSLTAIVTKYLNQYSLLVDYVPLLGPLYNATYALNLLYCFWPSKAISSGPGLADDDDEGDDASVDEIELEKARIVRVRGLTAVATALIDLFTLCLAVGVIAFVCDCLTRIATFAIIRQLVILFIVANVVALTVGSKLITRQLVEHLTRQLEEVNSVGTSMVKSVTITATAIERIVETTNTKTEVMVQSVSAWCTTTLAWVEAVVFAPVVCWRSVVQWLRRLLRQYRAQVDHTRATAQRMFVTMRHYLPIKVKTN